MANQTQTRQAVRGQNAPAHLARFFMNPQERQRQKYHNRPPNKRQKMKAIRT